MTRKMFALAALGALAAATPAAAQWNGSVVDTQSLRAQIDDGVARGDISDEDAASLRSQLRGLVNLQRQYAQDGLSASEREDLRQRAQGLRNEIAEARGGAPSSGYGGYANGSNGYSRYGNGYGSGNGYGATTYGNRYGGSGYGTYNNGTYGNRGYTTYGNSGYGNGAYTNRYSNDQYQREDDSYRSDGRYDRNDSYDRDDTYDEGDGLRVGERVSGGLYAVPNAYRYRFRDGGGVYYRYGDGNVYQIDARSGVVLRIYRVDQ